MCREDGKNCEGSAHVKTKVGNRMFAGDGIQRGYGRPQAIPCIKCHVSASNPSSSTFLSQNDPEISQVPVYENSFEDDWDGIMLLNNAADFVKSMDTATTLLEKGFLWGKAVNPNPALDFWLGVIGQGISDFDRSDLTFGQRIGRAGAVGIESMVTGAASEVAGALGFIGGEAIAPSGGGIVGYAGLSLAVSVGMDEGLWRNMNQKYFFSIGLGTYP